MTPPAAFRRTRRVSVRFSYSCLPRLVRADMSASSTLAGNSAFGATDTVLTSTNAQGSSMIWSSNLSRAVPGSDCATKAPVSAPTKANPRRIASFRLTVTCLSPEGALTSRIDGFLLARRRLDLVIEPSLLPRLGMWQGPFPGIQAGREVRARSGAGAARRGCGSGSPCRPAQ